MKLWPKKKLKSAAVVTGATALEAVELLAELALVITTLAGDD